MLVLYLVSLILCFLVTAGCFYFYLRKLGVTQALSQRSCFLSFLVVGVTALGAVAAAHVNGLVAIMAIGVIYFMIRHFLEITKTQVFALIVGLYIVNVVVVSVTLMVCLPSYQAST
ncbi:hypothetical protein [uncultured Shewanella sp.]|uniref:hypothetical protein n=1 Tax=uncultured Shewanella sp. TaxID=173975 RepID=UPI002631582E|nr:hypothetical protein [uncultured Shewanella sp.]